MNRLQTVALGILIATILAPAQTPEKGSAAAEVRDRTPESERQLDADPALFTVLAAINAAGYDAGANSAAAHPLRAFIRQQLAAKDLPSIRAMKEFYRDHLHQDPAADLAPYISFALSIDGPPEFQFRPGTFQVPPDARELAELSPILALFYEEAGIADLWRQSQPAFDQIIGLYHRPLSRAILDVNAYLRSATSGVLGHRFQVSVDLLGPPGGIQARNYRADTYVVITPAIATTPERTKELAAEQVGDVRHAFLHSLLDPLAVRYHRELEAKEELHQFAKDAPALEPLYKTDFLMLASESLIKAVEARLSPDPAAKREAMVNEALHEGYVLTPAFYEGLAAYEKQGSSMRMYYPDLVNAINLKAERRRLTGMQFAEAPARRVPDPVASSRPLPSNAEKLLAEAEDLADRRQLEVARVAFQKVLEEPPQPNVRARAYFGLARIAALQKDPEAAEKMFLKALDAGPDGETRCWAYYYLGRLEDAAEQREEALKYFRLAVDTPGGSRKAKDEARKTLDAESAPNNGSR